MTSAIAKPRNMKSIVEEMHTPAPKHVVDGLCSRLRDIETAESGYGEELANECRSFIFQQAEVKWLDVLVAAYLINGGVILREADCPQQYAATTQEEPSLHAATLPTPDVQASQSAPSAPMPGVDSQQQPPLQNKAATGSAVTESIAAPATTQLDREMLEIEDMVNSLGVDAAPLT